MAHDVFISYSSKDKPIGDGICASLEAAGIRCWIAPRDIGYGEDWPTSIANAISKSRVMVLIFSTNSNASDQISRELSLSSDSKLVIIPFKIDDAVPEPGKQYYLARTHWLDAMSPPTKEQIQSLVERVSAILPSTMASPESSAAKPVERKKARPLLPYLLIVGAVIGLLLVAAGVFANSQSSVAAVASPSSVAIAPTDSPAASTPTLAIAADPTISPSLQATGTPNATRTAAPGKTKAPSTADQASVFAAPILAAIANRPPDYQDDFGDSASEWNVYQQNQGGGYVDGEFSIVALPAKAGSQNCSNGASSSRLREFSDLVLEIDERAELGGHGDMQVQFRQAPNVGYAAVIQQDGYLTLLRNDSGQNVNLLQQNGVTLHRPSDGNHLQIIAQGARIALSANGKPLALVSDPSPLQGGGISLTVCNKSSTQTQVRFDNIKIWDISDLPASQ